MAFNKSDWEVYFFAVQRGLVEHRMDYTLLDIANISEQHAREYEEALLELAMLETEREKEVKEAKRLGHKPPFWSDLGKWRLLFNELNCISV